MLTAMRFMPKSTGLNFSCQSICSGGICLWWGKREARRGDAVILDIWWEVFADGVSIRHITKQRTKAGLLKMDIVSQGVDQALFLHHDE